MSAVLAAMSMKPAQEAALSVLIAAIVIGLVAMIATTRLPSLRGRAVVALALATVVPFLALLVSGALMLDELPETPLLIVSGGAMLIAAAAAATLIRSVVSPLRGLSEAAERIAGGELAARAPETGLRETDALARSFNEMAGAVEELFDARSQLVAWASHDLRTPLAAMRAMLEAIEDGVADADEYLPAMAGQVERMSALVSDLLELASIDAGTVQKVLDQVKVADVLDAVSAAFTPQARAAEVTLKVSGPASGETLRCDPAALERVLSNLVSNALRHTPRGGTIELSAGADAAEVVITVADSGPGLDSGDYERVFQQFYRGDPARSSPGAGLGLAIARGLVEAHGGSISAAPSRMGGAAFTLRVPRDGPSIAPA
jgi:signal transduction histidine kinase